MKAFYTDEFVLPLPPGHRFPMEKYGLVRKLLEKTLLPRRLAVFREVTRFLLAKNSGSVLIHRRRSCLKKTC